jgi:FtsZ-interacting cell division protein ZipA
MAAWIWILIAIGALVVVALLVFGARRSRDRRQRREQVRELRQEVDTRTRQAEERERVAQEQVQEARESRRIAAEVGARADRLDPDREGREDD